MGPVFCVVLLLTVVITNVPLRGLWSFLVLLLFVVIALIITLIPQGWDDLLKAIGNLHIYINMAGYLFIAIAVLILWAVSVFIFDQRTYMRVTPGQIQVCEHVGASIRNFDTMGLSFEKQRDDLFRHWLLGLLLRRPDRPHGRARSRKRSACRTCCGSAGGWKKCSNCSARRRQCLGANSPNSVAEPFQRADPAPRSRGRIGFFALIAVSGFAPESCHLATILLLSAACFPTPRTELRVELSWERNRFGWEWRSDTSQRLSPCIDRSFTGRNYVPRPSPVSAT